MNENKIIIASGYFNPLHIGHLRYLKAAKALGRELVVIVNNDKQVELKGSVPFMPLEERLEMVMGLKYVDRAITSIDTDRTQNKTIRLLGELLDKEELIFAKGGDSTPENTPEIDTCERYGISVVFGAGGDKIQSSSWLIKGKNVKKK